MDSWSSIPIVEGDGYWVHSEISTDAGAGAGERLRGGGGLRRESAGSGQKGVARAHVLMPNYECHPPT